MAGVRISVDVTGIAGISLTLSQLLARIEVAIRDALPQIAARLKTELRARVPVRTGALRQSIRVRSNRSDGRIEIFGLFYFNPVNARVGFVQASLAAALPDIRRILESAVRSAIQGVNA